MSARAFVLLALVASAVWQHHKRELLQKAAESIFDLD